MARVRRDGHLDLPRLRHARFRSGQVVLDVTRPALLVGDQRVDRALALELPEDRRIGTADGVGEDVEPPAMRDPDQDLVRTRLGGELDGLVEHGHEHVETLDRELLLPDERAAEVCLEPFDLREPAQQVPALLGIEVDAEPAGLDGLAQPDALGVVGDVLDLVRDRPRVDVAQARQCLEQVSPGTDKRSRRAGMRSCSSSVRGGCSRVSSRAGSPIGSDPSGSRWALRWPCMRYAFTSDIAAATPPRSSSSGVHGRRALDGRLGEAPARRPVARAAAAPFPPPSGASVDETLETGKRGQNALVAALEDLAPRRIHRLGIVEVLLEELPDVSGVQAR